MLSMEPAGLAEGQPGPSANSGRNSEETRMAVGRNGSHNCKPCHHCGLSKEVKIWVEAEVKTGKALDGTFKGNVLMTVKMIKFNLFIQIKARTSRSCFIERKFGDGKGHSGRAILQEGEVAESIVGESLIGRKFNSLKRGEAVDEVAVQLAVAKDVVGLVEVDDKLSGSPEII